MIENNELAKYYDLLYHNLKYKQSATRIKDLAQKYSAINGNMLLDVACGTGTLITHLKSDFKCTGIDISSAMIDEAKKKTNEVEFKLGDMRTFSLPPKFDVITCLFNSLNYLQNTDDLESTIANFYIHLNKGGIAICELFHEREKIFGEFNQLRTYAGNDLKIVRISELKSIDKCATFDLHYLISEKGKSATYIKETINLNIYTKKEIVETMTKEGFRVKYLQKGFYGKGLFIGIK
jgi:ubiquinone/menaquinone biosynthesis C-methylase UbiE